jgi:hypothetical protein
VAVPGVEIAMLELVRKRTSRSITTVWASVPFASKMAFSSVGDTVIVEFVVETDTLNVMGWKLMEQRWLPMPAYQSP